MNTLIHIGYHKTATTWLQNHFFNNQSAGFVSPFSRKTMYEMLLHPHPLDFDPLKSKATFHLSSQQREANDTVVALSEEHFCGSPHTGGHYSKEYADRLIQIFPHAKFLIVIREQQRIIQSTYTQYVKGGGSHSLQNYLKAPFDFDHFKYHRLITYYQNKVGKDKVLILPYEQFQRTPRLFVQHILQFCGIADGKEHILDALPYQKQVHMSLSSSCIPLRRRLSRIVGEKSTHRLESLFPIKKQSSFYISCWFLRLERVIPHIVKRIFERRMHQKIARLLGDRYQESNAITSCITGLPLAEYGYDVVKQHETRSNV